MLSRNQLKIYKSNGERYNKNIESFVFGRGIVMYKKFSRAYRPSAIMFVETVTHRAIAVLLIEFSLCILRISRNIFRIFQNVFID